MNCQEFQTNLFAYIEGELSSKDDVEAFEEHLASCDKCWDEFSEINAVLNLLKESRKKAFEESPAFKELHNKIRELINTNAGGDKISTVLSDGFSTLRSKIYNELTPATIDLLIRASLKEAESMKAQGKVDESLKCYEEALSLKPSDNKILNQMQNFMATYLTVFLNGVQQSIEQIRGVLLSKISETGSLVVKLGQKIISDYKIETSHIKIPATRHLPQDMKVEQEPSITDHHGPFLIELYPGEHDANLTIKINIKNHE